MDVEIYEDENKKVVLIVEKENNLKYLVKALIVPTKKVEKENKKIKFKRKKNSLQQYVSVEDFLKIQTNHLIEMNFKSKMVELKNKN